MSYPLEDLCAMLECLWPSANACDWDNAGLIATPGNLNVKRVFLSVDVTSFTVSEAQVTRADLFISHHPPIFKPVKKLSDNYEGSLLLQLIQSECAVFSIHTNADIAPDGLAQHWSDLLGLVDSRPIRPIWPKACGTLTTTEVVPNGDPKNSESENSETASQHFGFGRIGNLPDRVTLFDLANICKKILPSTVEGIKVAGDKQKAVRRIAICPGAGDEFLDSVLDLSADVYITSDLRHHPALGFKEKGAFTRQNTALISISHYAAECLWLEYLGGVLKKHFPNLSIAISSTRGDPWDFRV